MNLQLSLKKQWFEMTKSGIKTEDYREITPNWCNRFLLFNGKKQNRDFWRRFFVFYNKEDLPKIMSIDNVEDKITFEFFTQNKMTLGYPKETDAERIIKFEHAGIEIRIGNPDWGAEPEKLYFVIKHGKQIK